MSDEISSPRLKTIITVVAMLFAVFCPFADISGQDDPPSADKCDKAIGDGYALTNWGAVGRNSSAEASFADLMATLCRSGCYGFCFDLNTTIADPALRSAVSSCRQGADLAACKVLFRNLRLPAGGTSPLGSGQAAADKLCLYAGGPRCFVPPHSVALNDAMSVAAAKMACMTGITGACVLHDRHVAQTAERARSACDASGGSACSDYVAALFRNGQVAKAQEYGLKVCSNEKSGQDCLEFTRQVNEFKQGPNWFPKLEELCITKRFEAACGPWITQLVKEKRDTVANQLAKELCLNSNKRWFQTAVCSDYGVRLLAAGDQKGAESVIRRSCGLGLGQVPGPSCPAMSYVEAARNKSRHFSRVHCRKAGKSDFIDRSGQVVISVECAEGLRHGTVKFESSNFETLPFLFSDMEIPYQKGVVSGLVKVRAYVQDMDYNYYAFTDGKLDGVAQVGGYRSSFRDGALHGRNVSTAYGRVSEVAYEDGRPSLLKRPPKMDCRNKPELDKRVRDVIGSVTAGCVWKEKDDVVVMSDGTIGRRRMQINQSTVIQTLRDGAVTLELNCREQGKSFTVKSYQATKAEESTYRNTQPTFKRVEFNVQNGRVHGPAAMYQLGELKFSGNYNNGVLKGADGCY